MRRQQQLKATAYHEAGHMVAAWRQGMKIRRATIVLSAKFMGQVEHESPLKGIRFDIDGSDRAYLRAEKAILICLAGPAAQRHWKPRSWRHYHGAMDYELAGTLRLQGSGELATAYLRWLDVKARSSIENNWRLVVAFAGRLLERGSIDFAEIEEVIASMSKARYEKSPPALHIPLQR